MSNPKSSRSHLRGLVLLAIAVIAVPALLAWGGHHCLGWTADWFGAIGSVVGAAGSTAAIVWAVILFKRDIDEKRGASEQADQIARGDADQVEVTQEVETRRRAGKRYLGGVSLIVTNTSLQPVYLRKISIQGRPEIVAVPDQPRWQGISRHLPPGERIVFPRHFVGKPEINEDSTAHDLGFTGSIEFQQGTRYWTKTATGTEARELSDARDA